MGLIQLAMLPESPDPARVVSLGCVHTERGKFFFCRVSNEIASHWHPSFYAGCWQESVISCHRRPWFQLPLLLLSIFALAKFAAASYALASVLKKVRSNWRAQPKRTKSGSWSEPATLLTVTLPKPRNLPITNSPNRRNPKTWLPVSSPN